MMRLETEVKQITHAIRMAACNAETTLARALDGHYARSADEACALIREALTTSGDIIPGNSQLTQARTRYPGTDLTLRYEVKPPPRPCMILITMSGVLGSRQSAGQRDAGWYGK